MKYFDRVARKKAERLVIEAIANLEIHTLGGRIPHGRPLYHSVKDILLTLPKIERDKRRITERDVRNLASALASRGEIDRAHVSARTDGREERTYDVVFCTKGNNPLLVARKYNFF